MDIIINKDAKSAEEHIVIVVEDRKFIRDGMLDALETQFNSFRGKGIGSLLEGVIPSRIVGYEDVHNFLDSEVVNENAAYSFILDWRLAEDKRAEKLGGLRTSAPMFTGLALLAGGYEEVRHQQGIDLKMDALLMENLSYLETEFGVEGIKKIYEFLFNTCFMCLFTQHPQDALFQKDVLLVYEFIGRQDIPVMAHEQKRAYTDAQMGTIAQAHLAVAALVYGGKLPLVAKSLHEPEYVRERAYIPMPMAQALRKAENRSAAKLSDVMAELRDAM